MDPTCSSALIHGYERMAAWSDLLDQINVFPVADADTGRNLKISLAPLRQLDTRPDRVPMQLVRAATGNSGNIAAAFFHELLGIDGADALPEAVQTGSRQARNAVAHPQPGTMLSVFDALAEAMEDRHRAAAEGEVSGTVDHLRKAVSDSSDALPVMKCAGVVDAGALGMFIFLEAFLSHLAGRNSHHRPVTEIFTGKLTISPHWKPEDIRGDYCVNATLRPRGDDAAIRNQLAAAADSVVVTGDGDHLKVHLHTGDRVALRNQLKPLGEVVGWSEERIVSTGPDTPPARQPIHIMTDAAGSMTIEEARQLGVTLLSSYLVVGEQAWPETLFAPDRLYSAMRNGIKASTAQASQFERHQSYLSAISRFKKVLYLCVGSVYTGNFDSALAWKAKHDPGDRLAVIDTGLASGRLGIVAEATARFSNGVEDRQAVIDFARLAMAHSRELVFLDQLKYLAAGGRISRTKGFFGDLFHKKPIISPTAHGAARVGVASNRHEQLDFGLDRLNQRFSKSDAPDVLLQYSDNRTWVRETAAERIHAALPKAGITVRPLSLTAGAHMGPGTWALAYLPRLTAP
jgi:DegV family protein with EDD domain